MYRRDPGSVSHGWYVGLLCGSCSLADGAMEGVEKLHMTVAEYSNDKQKKDDEGPENNLYFLVPK